MSQCVYLFNPVTILQNEFLCQNFKRLETSKLDFMAHLLAMELRIVNEITINIIFK